MCLWENGSLQNGTFSSKFDISYRIHRVDAAYMVALIYAKVMFVFRECEAAAMFVIELTNPFCYNVEKECFALYLQQ